MLSTVTATGIRLHGLFGLTFFKNAHSLKIATKQLTLMLFHLFHKFRGQLWFPWWLPSCYCYHSEWIFSVQETRDDADMGETFVSSCEWACEDASDASKTAGAPAYSAVFEFPVWMSRWGDSPHLEDGRNNNLLDMLHNDEVIVW